MKEMGRYCEQK